MKKYFAWIAILSILCPLSLTAPNLEAQVKDPGTTAPAASNSLVISQVQPGVTGNATDEFVEIHNISANPIDLNGYRLVYRSQNGSADLTFFAWGASTVVQPGH